MIRSAFLSAALVSLLLPGAFAPAHAQNLACPWPGPPELLTDRPSPPDSTLFSIGSRTVKVCYSRPSARERQVYGELVPYGRTWRTGANEPTMLNLPVPAEVAGVRLEAGTYLMLTIPQSSGDWTILFNTSDAPPDEMFDNMTEVARGTAPVEPLDDHVEMFTIRGTDAATAAALLLEWERLRVRVPIRLLEQD